MVGTGGSLDLSELEDSIKILIFFGQKNPGTGIDYILDGNFNNGAENAKILKRVLQALFRKDRVRS